MSARALMIQGTGSDVGKSAVVAGLCRIARQLGYSVAPFKPQNMSNNAAACADGGEIGRAQAVQARAAGIDMHVDLNPVLLKPQSDCSAQVVVHGRVMSAMDAAHYMNSRDQLLKPVLESFQRLSAVHDLVIVEGAGSPAEVNLRQRDIANMGFALRTGTPVCLLGDIDRGGVIAAIVGTQAVISRADAAMVRCFAINKFRGDPTLFEDGVRFIEQRTGWPCMGVIPWLDAPLRLPQEDAVVLQQPVSSQANSGERLKIVAPMLSRIANFDDMDPLRAEPGVNFSFIPPGQAIPRDADVIILLGTKSTLGDLKHLRSQGWDHDILAHARSGGRVLGLCGGYQLLGTRIVDGAGVDGSPGEAQGLGLLDVETQMSDQKRVRQVRGRCVRTGAVISGYEIHMGNTHGPDTRRAFATLDDGVDGAVSNDGLIEGSYLHGVFESDSFRSAWLEAIRSGSASAQAYSAQVDRALDDLAAGLSQALDIERLFNLAVIPDGQLLR